MDLFFDSIPNEILEQILGYIVSRRNLVSLKLVCKRFKQLVDYIYDPTESGGKHLLWNLECGNSLEVTRLLQDERILNNVNQGHYFYDIAVFGDLSVIKLIIDDPRIDPNMCPDSHAYHHVIIAYLYGKLDVFEFLISHPKFHTKFDCDSILHASTSQNCLRLVERLVLNERIEMSSNRAICELRIFAYKYGNVNLWKYLKDKYPYTMGYIMELLTHIPRSDQVLNTLLDDECLECSDLETRIKVYKGMITISYYNGFVDSVKKILEKGLLLEGVDVMSMDTVGSVESTIQILKLLIKCPSVKLSYRPKTLVSLNDTELIQLVLDILPGLHSDLLKEAVVQSRKDIVAFILKGRNRNASQNMNLAICDLVDPFSEAPPDMVEFILNDLGICFSCFDSRLIFRYACFRENGEIVELLLSNEKFFQQLPHSFIKDEILPSLVLLGKTKLVAILSKFIR